MIKSIKKTVALSAMVLAGMATHNTVFAQASEGVNGVESCSSVNFYAYTNCYADNTASTSSSVVTATAVLSTAASQASGLVGNRVSSALGGSSSFNLADNGFTVSSDSMAAGDYRGKFGAWVSGTYSDVEDNNAATAFDGNVYSAMAGIDYKVTPRTIVGLAVGYEDTDLDTTYNRGSLEADGYTIAPYIGHQLTENASVNLTVGYSDLEYDVRRLDPNNNVAITGSTDATRWFVDAGINGKHNLQGNWNLFGEAGVFFASEDKDAYTENEAVTGNTIAVASRDTDLGVASLEAKLAYTLDMVEPYALVGVSHDFSKDEAPVAAGQNRSSLDDEDFAAKFGAGLNFQLAPNVTGSLEGYTVEFRDDYDEYTFTGGLRVKF